MGILEQPGRARILVAGLIVAGLGLAAAITASVVARRAARPAVPAAARAVPGEEDGRVVVEVLNATAVTGLARGVTRRLRDAGLDVVYFGQDAAGGLDSTEVLVRRGDLAAGERVRRALGGGSVRAAPAADRLVDVTVRLGRDAARAAALARDP